MLYLVLKKQKIQKSNNNYLEFAMERSKLKNCSSQLIVIFSIITILAECDLSFSPPVTPLPSNPQLYLFQDTFQNSVALTLYAINYDFLMCVEDSPTRFNLNKCNLTGTSYGGNVRARIAPGNIFGGQNQYVFFNATLINRHSNFATTITTVSTFFNQNVCKIQDAIFGVTFIQLFVLLSDNSTNIYTLNYLRNNLYVAAVTLSVPMLNNIIIKSFLQNGNLFYLFTNCIKIYSANSSMIQLNSINFPLNSQRVSLDVKGDYLVYAVDNNCKILNYSNKCEMITEIFQNQLITDAILSYPYLVISTLNYIHQYDLQIHTYVNSSQLDTTDRRMTMTAGNLVYFYIPFPTLFRMIHVRSIDPGYSCVDWCISCLPTYSLSKDNFTCIKNQSAIIPRNATTVEQTLSAALTVSSCRLLPDFLYILTLAVDDVSYYSYHHWSYPQSINIYFQGVNVLNDLRIQPSYIVNFVNLVYEEQVAVSDNKYYWRLIQFDDKNPNGVYFFYSAQPMYKFNFICNLFLFLFIKLFHFLCYLMQKRIKSLVFLYHWIKISSKWWSFVTMIIQSNVMMIGFTTIFQFLVPSFFNFFNKINIIISSFCLFILTSYVIAFYPLIYSFYKKNSSSSLLIRTKYSWKSFFIQPICGITFNFIRSIIHATLLNYYSTQILMLSSIDLLFLIVSFSFKNYFVNKIIFVSNLLIFASHFVLDILFTLYNRNSNIFSSVDYDSLILIAFFSYIGSIILFSVILALVALYDLIIIQKRKQVMQPYENAVSKQNYIVGTKLFLNQEHIIPVMVTKTKIKKSIDERETLQTIQFKDTNNKDLDIIRKNIKRNKKGQTKNKIKFVLKFTNKKQLLLQTKNQNECQK